MKIYFTLFISFLLGSQICSAQEKLSETEKLASTAKIWGFLKYYHPEVADGKFDWDAQLFEILPKVEKAENKTELSAVFSQWIESLGKIKKCNSCRLDSKKEYFNKNFDLNWTQNKNVFSEELCEKLKYIEENRFQGNQYYVKSTRVGNIEIKNEPEYKDFDWNNKNLRILSLFKYWNIIEYFYPYKYQTDQKWDTVLTEMLPKFLNPTSEDEYHLTMLELVVKINDAHGMFITHRTNNYFGFKWLPADFSIIDNKVILTKFYNDTLAKKDDLRIGDVITKVDGKTISQILERTSKYINASNSASKLRNTNYSIFNGSTDTVEIEYQRDGNTQSKTVSRYLFKDLNYKFSWGEDKWKVLDGNIGYVNMGNVTLKDVPKMMEELKNTIGIIFDIRNYPKGTMYQIANYINPAKTDFYKMTEPDLDYPGRFIWKDGGKCGSNSHEKYKGKIIILVNEETQSHAEFTTMGFQANKNAIVIGSQTAGADGNISRLELVGGFKTLISGIGIFYPDGKETQRIGIVPNIEVKPTITGIQKGQDEVLDKAIEVMNTKSF